MCLYRGLLLCVFHFGAFRIQVGVFKYAETPVSARQRKNFLWNIAQVDVLIGPEIGTWNPKYSQLLRQFLFFMLQSRQLDLLDCVVILLWCAPGARLGLSASVYPNPNQLPSEWQLPLVRIGM